jgi:hypothetical protein
VKKVFQVLDENHPKMMENLCPKTNGYSKSSEQE